MLAIDDGLAPQTRHTWVVLRLFVVVVVDLRGLHDGKLVGALLWWRCNHWETEASSIVNFCSNAGRRKITYP